MRKLCSLVLGEHFREENSLQYSIVMPYKETDKKMFNDCLDSLNNQTFKDFEVLFIHDGDSNLHDEIKNINFNYKVLESTVSSNPQYYRNRGIKEAMGEYILFMDSDDYLHPNSLSYANEIINEEHDFVVKLGVKNTHYTKSLTFKENTRSFYKPETSEKLRKLLTDINKENVSNSEFINKLYELELVKHSYNNIKQNKFLDNINYRLKSNGLIINRQFIIDHELEFDTTNSLYGDIPFVIRLYNLVDRIKQTKVKLYFKLIHNDSISYPSHTQKFKETKSYYKLLAYDKALNYCPNLNLARKLKGFATREYLYYVCKSEDFRNSFNNVKPIYSILRDLLNKPSKRLKINVRHKLEINAIKNREYRKAYNKSRRRVKLYNTYKFLKPKNERYRKKVIQKNIFTKLPIRKDLVVYESFLGKNYSDSPKAIFEYLKSSDSDKFKHVWILNNKDILEDYPILNDENVKIIDRFSWEYFYYVTVAKYFILNMRQPKWLVKKKDQTILSTWHGTPLKRLVFDMDNVTSASKSYKQDFYQQSRNWDYLIAANKYSEQIFERAFKYPTSNILTYGYPRNDILSNYNQEYKNKVKQKLNIPTDKKVVLYAPTWRDDEYHGVGQYKFSLNLDLEQMRQELGEEYIVLLRMHYFISDRLDISEYEGFAFDFSKYNDVNDLYIVSDILITDYSSVFFDYANLKRPILFYTYDLDKYKDELRGFYIDMEKDLPGPLLFDSLEVINNIKNIEVVNNNYKERYEAFYNKFCLLDDGKATKRVVEKVIK